MTKETQVSPRLFRGIDKDGSGFLCETDHERRGLLEWGPNRQMAQTDKVTDSDFEAQVLRAERPVLVDFYADWCGPCHMVAPEVEALAGELEGRLKVVKLDIDANPKTAERFGVMSIPTLLLFNGGKEELRLVGARRRDDLRREIEPRLGATGAIR